MITVGLVSMMSTLPASAGSVHSTYTYTLPFTLTGGPLPLCPMLPDGFVIQGTVEGIDSINTRVDQNGITYVEINSLEDGSATDSNGATYVVNYHNHFSYQVPPGGYPFTDFINDHFNLVGNGLATQLQVRFVIRFTQLSSTDPGTLQIINKKGNAFACDVI
jgi:hypothetical protein